MREAIISLRQELELDRLQQARNEKKRTIIGVIIVMSALIWALTSNNEARRVIVDNTRLKGMIASKDSVIRGLRETNIALKNSSWVSVTNSKQIDKIEQRIDTLEKWMGKKDN